MPMVFLQNRWQCMTRFLNQSLRYTYTTHISHVLYSHRGLWPYHDKAHGDASCLSNDSIIPCHQILFQQVVCICVACTGVGIDETSTCSLLLKNKILWQNLGTCFSCRVSVKYTFDYVYWWASAHNWNTIETKQPSYEAYIRTYVPRLAVPIAASPSPRQPPCRTTLSIQDTNRDSQRLRLGVVISLGVLHSTYTNIIIHCSGLQFGR